MLAPRVIDVRTNYGEEVVRSTKRGEPRQVEERRGQPFLVQTIEKDPKFIEERIIGIHEKSKILTSKTEAQVPNKNMLIESMQRIMLLSMENKRLQNSNHNLKA